MPAPKPLAAITQGAAGKPRVARRQATIPVPCLNIPNPPRPCRDMAHPRVTRVAGTKPGLRSTGESFRIPMQRSVVSPKRKLPHSPCPHRRLTELRSGPFEAVHTKLGIDSVELTLIGLLRHSKLFFGMFQDPFGNSPIDTNAALRPPPG